MDQNKYEDRHPLDRDELIAADMNKAVSDQAIRDRALVHAVFAPEHGQLLLKRWKKILMVSPSAHAQATLLEVGMNEGYKNFIRVILTTLEMYDEDA